MTNFDYKYCSIITGGGEAFLCPVDVRYMSLRIAYSIMLPRFVINTSVILWCITANR